MMNLAVFVVLVQLLTLVSTATARSSSFASPRRVPFVVGRGGGKRATTTPSSTATVATDTEYTAVGVVPSEVLDTETISSLPFALQQAFQQDQQESCSLIMFKKNNPTSLCLVERNPEMLETLSMTCHVLVLFLSNNEMELQPEVIKAILEGARRRRRLAGHDKLKLILVLAGSSSATDETRVALALKELQDFAPQDLDAFEMTTVQQLPTVWNEMMEYGHDDTSEFIDEEGLAKLIETIYESLSHKKCNVNLRKWKQQPRLHHASVQAIVADEVMTQVQPLFEKLESTQQQVWLNPDENVPMLEFGTEANGILEMASSIIDASQPPLSKEERREILLGVASRLKVLYDQQLASLREHYGRRYEAALENEDQEQWTVEAQQVTQAFRAAGLHAIPRKCQEGQELADADFSYVMELQGLIADMMEATSSREEMEGYIDDDEGDGTPQPRVAKWYEKLAARAVVLGINYLQGYMAWQAIQRAAVERDKAVPKFPLF